MQIDRSNYAIWIIDWLDGNLSTPDVDQLKLFLSENPDLQEESEELTQLNLQTSSEIFPAKDLLKKSSRDLPLSQFEYLSVAYLEGDLSAVQKTELFEIINSDSLKKREFELIQLTKILTPDIHYTGKNKLFKRTAAQKAFRISVYGLSTAAAIVLIILSLFTIPRNLPVNNSIIADNIYTESIDTKQSKVAESIMTSTDNKLAPANKKNSNGIDKINSGILTSETHEILSEYLIVARDSATPQFKPVIVPVHVVITIKDALVSNELVASKPVPVLPATSYENDRSKFSRFIAKTFREKILKEESSPDTPLRGYEFAEAGVSGINKLLGWEMALEKTNDSNGEVKSLYFSSNILKFQTPVKKSESLP